MLGPYTVEQGPQPLFLPQGLQSPQPDSEATAEAIDHEAQEIVARMAQRARQLLLIHRATLETLAQYVLVHEAIDQSTLAFLLGEADPNTQSEPLAW